MNPNINIYSSANGNNKICKQPFYHWFHAVTLSFLLACGGGSDSSSEDDDTPVFNNTAPTANAGNDQNVTTGELVNLNGSGSSDSNGDNLTYNWSFTSTPNGSSASLTNATSETPNFTVDIEGDYIVSLTVNDGTTNSSADSVTITATTPNSNIVPIADAGSDQNVTTGDSVNLDGSGSSDSDGDPLTYSWSFTSSPNGSNAVLANATTASPSFTADIDGSYIVSLTVNDGTEDSAPDSITITAATGNSAPVANAGSDQAIETGNMVNLDGSASTDSDNDSLTYSWNFSSIPGGSSASLSGATTDSPSFTADVDGTYTVALTVNDGTVDSTSDSVNITATTTINNAPVADAGDDIQINTDNTITLDGSNSTDADLDLLTYSWTITSAPNGSTALLSNATVQSPTFTPDVDGNYAIELVVNDGTDDSNVDIVLVTAAGWLINNSVVSDNIAGTLVNVQSITSTVVNGVDMIEMQSTGIPDYEVTMTQADVDALNNRPNAATDFKTGSTSASVNDIIAFGQSLGYKIQMVGCNLEYWPPGPQCPSDQSNVENIPIKPQVSNDTCNTSTNTMGYMLNGTAVFNWSDGASYNNQNVWSNIAPLFEFYDVDICLGHAQQQGNYHHHMFSQCLMDLLGDDGTGHSPIHGYAADGYPIYGPYYAAGVLAKSAWVARDYDNAASASGCGVAGVRNCQLVDQYDLSKGTTTVALGPTTSETVTSMSGNDFTTTSGHYFEDFYYDSSLTALGGEYLDEHNGHSHGNYGYHYHTTVVEENGSLVAAFPFNIGPTFYGELPTGGITTCQ